VSHLTPAQSKKVFDQYGCWVKEICDGCGRPIGGVSWTIYGDPRAWCSAECREAHLPPEWRHAKTEKKKPDQAAIPFPAAGKICLSCSTPLAGKRAGSDFCGDTCRKRFHKKTPPKS
jgi:hypothetical protein